MNTLRAFFVRPCPARSARFGGRRPARHCSEGSHPPHTFMPHKKAAAPSTGSRSRTEQQARPARVPNRSWAESPEETHCSIGAMMAAALSRRSSLPVMNLPEAR